MKKMSIVIVLFVIFQVKYSFAMDNLVNRACIVESKVAVSDNTLHTVESNVCELEIDLLTLDSKVDLIDLSSSLDKACTVESRVDLLQLQVETIASKVEVNDALLDTVESAVDVIDSIVGTIVSKACTVDSKIDAIGNTITTIDSLLDTLDSIESKIDEVSADSATLESKLCVIDSSVDLVNSAAESVEAELSTIDSRVDVLDNKIESIHLQAVTLESNLDVVDVDVDTVLVRSSASESKLCVIDSKTDVIDNGLDNIKLVVTSSDSKSVVIAYDFEQTWTILQVIQDKLCSADSKTDIVSSLVDTIQIAVDTSGTFTVIEAIQEKACTADSFIDSIQATINQISSISFVSSFTVQDAILEKLCTIDSKVDDLEVTTTLLEPLQNCLGTPIRQSDVGTTGFTISTRGRYYLAENIAFAPGASANAITISADNVYLDLNGKVLEQVNNQTGVVGVETSGTRDSLSVVNGIIYGFTEECVLVPSAGSVTNALFEDLLIGNAGVSVVSDGICINNGSNVMFFKVTIDNISDDGLDLNDCSDILVNECVFSNCGMLQGSGLALDDGCQGVCIRSCLLSGNSSEGGIRIGSTGGSTGVSEVLIEKCSIINNANGVKTIGSGITRSDIVIRECVIEGNTIDGISMSTVGTNNRWVIINNQISNNDNHGIFLDATSANNIILFNSFVQNGGDNINEDTGTGPNTILGNFAFHSGGDSRNYSLSTTSITGAKSILSQTGAFPTTLPTYWYNISMTP